MMKVLINSVWKSVYTYEYMDCSERCNETLLPEKDYFTAA